MTSPIAPQHRRRRGAALVSAALAGEVCLQGEIELFSSYPDVTLKVRSLLLLQIFQVHITACAGDTRERVQFPHMQLTKTLLNNCTIPHGKHIVCLECRIKYAYTQISLNITNCILETKPYQQKQCFVWTMECFIFLSDIGTIRKSIVS